MSETNNDVILISGDGEEFQVSAKVASLSLLAAGMIIDDDEDERRIPLPNVRREILAKVLEFCNHYCDEKMTEFVKVSFCSINKYIPDNVSYSY